MSHQIRTPLNAIVGFSEMLQYAENEEERNEYLQIINSNNELLLLLISDILDLSKIESGSIDIKKESVDIIDLLNEIMVSQRARLNSTTVSVEMVTPLKSCIATIDRSRFAQVVNNFLSNAIKYTKDGHIKLRLDAVNEGLQIAVTDTGIGIAEEKQKLIFKRFEKLDSFAQGTGLGLAICKAIIDALGGEIGLESVKGEGSTFWAYIPCETEVVINVSPELVEEKVAVEIEEVIETVEYEEVEEVISDAEIVGVEDVEQPVPIKRGRPKKKKNSPPNQQLGFLFMEEDE